MRKLILTVVGMLWLMCTFSVFAGSSQDREWSSQPILASNLEYKQMRSHHTDSLVSYHVYTPPEYAQQTSRRFPVLYWLHGSGGGEKALPQLVRLYEQAIRDKRMPPVIIVFPYGMKNSLWVNSKDGAVPMENVIIHELVPQIDKTYRTQASRLGRMIEGGSMGGYGAARFGLKYPDLFGAISMISAGPLQQEFSVADGPQKNARLRQIVLQTVFGGDQNYFKTLSPWTLATQQAKAVRGKTLIRIAIGEYDFTLPENEKFSQHLIDLKVPHQMTIVPGAEHDVLQIYQGLGSDNWKFYQNFFD